SILKTGTCAANSTTRRRSRAAGSRATAKSCSASPRAREFRSIPESRADARRNRVVRRIAEARRQHYRRRSDYCAVTFGRRDLIERHDVRRDGFLGARAAASETVGIEQSFDQGIGIVVGFGQRFARGAPPEL